MAVFVSTTYFGDNSPVQEVLNQLAASGIDHVEIGSNHSPVNINSLKLFKDTKYIIHNYFPPTRRNLILNLASRNPQIRESSIKFIKNTIRICRKLQVKFYTIHPGFLGEAISEHKKRSGRNFDFVFKLRSKSKVFRQKILDQAIKVISELNTYANKNNVTLLVENPGSKTAKEFVLFDSAEELDRLKKGVGKDLKFNLNLAHGVLSGIDLNDQKVFDHLYKDSVFFEASEIKGRFDSHLPILSSQKPTGSLLEIYGHKFKKKNIILEYRNIPIKEALKSYQYINKLLDPRSPKIK